MNNQTEKNSDNSPSQVNKSSPDRPIPLIMKIFRLAFNIGGRISPKLTGCAAYKLWITPQRFKTPASEIKAQNAATIIYHQINGKNIATYQWGFAKKTILLIHGWSGRGTQLGNFAEPLVKSGFRVLSFDAPSHGESSGKQTNIYEIADTILALNHLYGPFDSVVTHSFGGPCLAIAMKKGLATSRVVNISPPAATAGLVNKFATALSISRPVENELMRCIEKKFGENVWSDSSMENNIGDLDVQALVIHDVDDVDVPWHEGQIIAQAWNKVRFIKTNKLGHRRILRDPTTIKTTVDFLLGHQPIIS